MRRYPAARNPATVVRLLTPGQVLVLAGVMPRRYALLVLVAGVGLRQGEAFGLALDRIDAAAEMITINQQVIIVDRRPVLPPPKTSASLRDVPMPRFCARRRDRSCRTVRSQ
jgi:integrase